MKNPEQLDRLLKQALSPAVEPGEELNRKIIDRLKEKDRMKPVFKKRMAAPLIAAAIILAMSVTAFAAWQLLSPGQVAGHLGNQTLAQAFKGENAIEINKSAVSGEYSFTLLGIVSGKNLSDFGGSAQDIHPDRTYAVVSIARQDGGKMPDTRDEEYGKVPFFVSPLIKGEKPWQVNIASMNGGYGEFVIDGVMYRLIECDGIEMFADRGLYLCINTGRFYDTDAFNYDEKTGEISLNTDYKGVSALFDLPLDKTKADPARAEKYLQELLGKPEGDLPSGETEAQLEIGEQPMEEELANGVVIPESVKEVTYDEKGMACYEYEGSKISFNVDAFFEKGQTGLSKVAGITEQDGKRTALQFSRDADGVITGRVVKLN